MKTVSPVAAIIYPLAALAFIGCTPVSTSDAAVKSSVQTPVHAEDLTPLTAMEIIDSSVRKYVITLGTLRRDSLTARFSAESAIFGDDLDKASLDVLEEATAEVDIANYTRAAFLFSDLVRAEPRCVDSRIGFAQALLGLAMIQEAIDTTTRRCLTEGLRRQASDQLTIASALDPRHPVGYGMFAAPVWIGRTGMSRWPSTERARTSYSSGNEAAAIGQTRRARTFYMQVIAEETSFGRGYLAIGDTYLREHRFARAIPWYRHAIAADSTDYLAWRLMAQCHAALGDTRIAEEEAIWAVIFNYQDRDSWELLNDLVNRSGSGLVRRRIHKRVEIATGPSGSVMVMVDTTLSQSGRVAWLAYAFVRAVWRYEGRYQARGAKYAAEICYRTTFEEEMEATTGMLEVWARERADDSTLVDYDLDELLNIASAGYLAEYVLLEEISAGNPDIVERVSPKGLRRLREYVRRFIIAGRNT